MSKRSYDFDGPPSPTKRLKPQPEHLLAGELEDDAFNDVLDDGTSSFSGSHHTAPTYAAQSAATPATTATTTRKFPSDLKTIKCTHPGCPKTFNRPARLAAHLRSHANDRAFRCPYEGCDKDYLEEKHLKQHIKGSHTKERNHVCPEEGCGKSFVTATRLRRHAAVHAGAEQYKCRGYDGCDQTFRKHSTLQRHIRTKHLGLPAHPCDAKGCEMGFDTPSALKRHVQREHGELRFWCDECTNEEEEGKVEEDGEEEDNETTQQAGFTTLALLNAHMRLEHVSCLFCETKCRGQAELTRHIETYHSGTSSLEDRKTVACTHPGCTKKFVKQSNLAVHIRTAHEGVRFICGQVDTFQSSGIEDWNWTEEGCGEEFSTKQRLEDHVRFVHLGQRRHKMYAPGGVLAAAESEIVEAISGTLAEAKRDIGCTVRGCGATFIRYHDLGNHLENMHGLSMAQPPEVQAESENLMDFSLGSIPQKTPSLSPLKGEDLYFAAGGFGDDEQLAEVDREWEDMQKLIHVDDIFRRIPDSPKRSKWAYDDDPQI